MGRAEWLEHQVAEAHLTIAELLQRARRPLFSFEFFPPKDAAAQAQLWQAIDHLEPLGPDFISVTYGANGSTRDRTFATTQHIVDDTSLRTVGHLTCVSQTRAELVAAIEAYAALGVNHILAIRGDPPGGPRAPWQTHPDGLANATELVRLVKETGEFCVGVGAFPDAHPEHRDFNRDVNVLLAKQDAGAEFAITQLFFDVERYVQLVDRLRKAGSTLPVIAGIMPITNVRQIVRFAELSGAEVPSRIADQLNSIADDPAAVRALGTVLATELSLQLLDAGAPGLHFYTQNRSAATREILASLLERRP